MALHGQNSVSCIPICICFWSLMRSQPGVIFLRLALRCGLILCIIFPQTKTKPMSSGECLGTALSYRSSCGRICLRAEARIAEVLTRMNRQVEAPDSDESQIGG